MGLSRKCDYALRAVLELAKRATRYPATIAEIAAAQNIPRKFLEVIMRELRQGGFVTSRRGPGGGYVLAVPAAELTVGRIVQFVDGTFAPTEGPNDGPNNLKPHPAFRELWAQLHQAMRSIYEATSFQDLAERDKELCRRHALDYCI